MQFYMKTGKCKFGAACKFHHPKDIQIQLSDEFSHTVEQTQTNSMLNGATGDTQPINPLVSPQLHNSKGLPVRLVLVLYKILWYSFSVDKRNDRLIRLVSNSLKFSFFFHYSLASCCF